MRSRVTNEIGYVIRAYVRNGEPMYRVGFPTGEWDLRGKDVAAALTGFATLTASATGVYPHETWLKRDGMRLLNAYRTDPAGALSNSRVEPKPHQISVLISCVEKTQSRMILADEVGLGKTIEAGLILKELRARGLVDRVLILVPAGLVSQWTYELRSKFNETFVPHDSQMLRYLRSTSSDNPWNVEKNVIASISLARSDLNRALIAEAEWDLVIVDEAHHARNWWNNGEPRPNQAFELLEDLHDRVDGLLLLTATPMQLHEFELYSMISLVEPGLFRDFADFATHRTDVAEINRQVAWLLDPRQPRGDVDALRALLRRLGAPAAIATSELTSPISRQRVAEWLSDQHRVSRAMLRNRKAYVGGFVTRKATRIPVDPTSEELELEQRTRTYIHRRHRRAHLRGERLPAFAVTTFQKLLCSSSHALALALEKRISKLRGADAGTIATDDPDLLPAVEQLTMAGGGDLTDELAELEDLRSLAASITDAKALELEKALRALFSQTPDEKVLVFTQFLGTMEMLRSRLSQHLEVTTFHGGLKLEEKDAAVRAFKERAQVMISSEAGGEGRNFQFAHILVNYDLPWNPMKIEQRIGRLDRVGQTRNVLVYNFQVKGTLDERILNVLEHRVRVFTESVGALEPVLGEVEARLDEICVEDVAAANRGIERFELDLEQQLEAARRQEEHMRDLVMDARSLRRDAVDELLGRRPEATPTDLKRFVLAALARYPKAKVEELGSTVAVDVPAALRQRYPRLEESYRGSFEYRAALADERLEFFAFGHPLVESLIGETQGEDFAPAPGAVRGNYGEDAVVVDYELRCTGVRDRVTTLSHVVTPTAIITDPELCLPRDPDEIVDISAWSSEMVDKLERLSRASAQERLDSEFESFVAENERLYASELERLRRRFAFERRRHQQRIAIYEQEISIRESYGSDPETRRAIAGYRAAITRARRRLDSLEQEEALAVERLEAARRPSAALRVLGVARVLPTN